MCPKAGSVLFASSELFILQADDGIYVYRLNDMIEIEKLAVNLDSKPVVAASANGLSITLLQQLVMGKYRAVEALMISD